MIRKSMLLFEAIRPKEEKEEWSATEISRKLDIPVQTVHRLLSSLEEYGFVYKSNETKKFRLSLALLKMGLAVRDSLSIRKSAIPIMEELTKKTKKSVYLTVPEGHEGIFVDCLHASPVPLLKRNEPIGKRVPLYAGASQKAILAYMSQAAKNRSLSILLKQVKLTTAESSVNIFK
ncbi:IclR family transcriptional regulator [Domibacillus tundrae]|uniref:IclR family transcriptional regulator n=1 Tax=Domibacillus tundrae TaxID=1587527 RepID=UPI0033991715